MIDFQRWANGQIDMESLLNEYGLSAGMDSKFADQALKNIRFLRMMNFITDEEAQRIGNRIIAKIGRALK